MKSFLSKVFTKKNIQLALIVLFSATFIVSAGFLADYYIESLQQKKQQQALSELVEQNTPTPTIVDDENLGNYDETFDKDLYTQPGTPEYTTITHPKTGKELTLLTKYVPLFELNQDVVGWIRIDGTNINYPVMQTPEWVNYYLTRDFNGNNSKHGAIYINESADVKLPSDNVTIYGHKMRDGTMFASLHKYKEKSFFKENPHITFDTIYEHHVYVIISVFTIAATWDTDFPYHEFVDGDEASFTEFVSKCKALSLYDTGVDAVYGDKLITLSTCEHSIDDGRLVVVAKRVL